MTDKLTIQMNVEIDLERLYWLLSTGLEGEISYWGLFSEGKYFLQLNEAKDVDFTLPEAYVNIHVSPNDDGEFTDYYRLDFDAFKSGLQVMAKDCPRHFADFINDHADGITSDVFIQCCCFGEIVYG